LQLVSFHIWNRRFEHEVERSAKLYCVKNGRAAYDGRFASSYLVRRGSVVKRDAHNYPKVIGG
jgi:hypothetical protein